MVYDCKYRYLVLGGEVGLWCRELLREVAMSKEMLIYAGSANRDHVHFLVGIPPVISIEGGAVSEGEMFAQAARGVRGIAEAVLEAASLGAGLLGGEQLERDG